MTETEDKKPQSHQQYKAMNKPKQNQPTNQVMQRHSPTPSQQMSAQSVSKKLRLRKKYTTIPPLLFFFFFFIAEHDIIEH